MNTGRAPTPQRLTERCSLYDFAAIHAWIANPVSYSAVSGGDAPHLHKPNA
ncbi:transcriptional regulator [Ralstonia sp. CHL-2022]|uniref:Transcriptional regulator n=1 Tax=Ralstonia mojiangensis TaxID=2953895 RepID=A0AAE3I219_9RALS|nr:transcriptional regulator [Ralstonia mojiangensis]MCT7315247.1 transcriptional regulator [Ralstonia mojiangensis]